MAETSTITITHVTGDGERLSGSIASSSDNMIKSDLALINGTTTATLPILYAGLKSLFMLADKAVSVVFKDSGGSTVATIALAANVPYVWTSQGLAANPFASDIATVVATASAVGTLNIRVIQDSTP